MTENATKHFMLTQEWIKIGTGPAYIDTSSYVNLHLGAAKPTANTENFHRIGYGYRNDLSVGSSLDIWARSEGALDVKVVITEGT